MSRLSIECVFCFRCVSIFGRGAVRRVRASRFVIITISIIFNCLKKKSVSLLRVSVVTGSEADFSEVLMSDELLKLLLLL